MRLHKNLAEPRIDVGPADSLPEVVPHSGRSDVSGQQGSDRLVVRTAFVRKETVKVTHERYPDPATMCPENLRHRGEGDRAQMPMRGQLQGPPPGVNTNPIAAIDTK